MFFKQIISIVLALTIFVAHTPPVFASNMISWGIPEINIQNALGEHLSLALSNYTHKNQAYH